MSYAVIVKLIGVFAVIGVGWGIGRSRVLGGPEAGRVVSNAAFYAFTPALLFRTTATIDLATLPWITLVCFFGPVVGLLLISYAWNKRKQLPRAGPSVRAISTTFGNTAQLGLPVAAALFGSAGLLLHVTIVSLHAVTLLTTLTVLVELDLARSPSTGPRPSLPRVVGTTVQHTVVHPVVLPVVVGLAWNLVGLPIPAVLGEVLDLLAAGVVPVSLIAIGMALEQYGVHGVVKPALGLSAAKLLVQPLLVFAAAHWLAGLHGLPLGVVALCAALPTGSNALLFAQRYDALEGEATAAIVISTVAFTVTGPLWLLLVNTVR